MRVGQFLAHFPGPGGSAAVLRGLSSGLVDLGHDVVVYGYGSAEGPVPEGIDVRLFRPPRITRRGLHVLSQADRLTRALAANEDRLDVLIVHGMFSPHSMRIAQAARDGGIRTIAQPHDPYSASLFHERRLAKSLYWRVFERRFLNAVDAVQVDPPHRAHLLQLGVHTPTLVVPAGISPESLVKAARARLLWSAPNPGTVRLLFVGRFDIHNKGLDLMLEALAAATGPGSHPVLELVGAREPSEYAAVADIVDRYDLTDRVRLTYRMDDPWEAFARADLFVLPSRFDGFGLVVLEALAIGTPVVLSSAAGAAEFVGDDPAVLVAEPSSDDLHRALGEATSRLAELRAAAEDAHTRIAQSFSWRACANRWLDRTSEVLPPAEQELEVAV